MALRSRLHDIGLLLRKATDEDCVYPASLPGELLHRRVPPDRWCVTQEDLRHLHRVVERAVLEGEIQPTERDAFDPQDRINGPNVYTVTEQFIKPVTRAAGQPSWALMRHPEGLECDIFVTHAWAEGIFEFIRKVLASWPSGARHAWCCMLANPQNLDIGHLVADPGRSPFAMALRVSKYVMVVPNRHISIYTRLWCAYEAYLGCCECKVIFTAHSCMGRAACRAYVALATVIIIILLIFEYAPWEIAMRIAPLQPVVAMAYLLAENVADAEPWLLLILNGMNVVLSLLNDSENDSGLIVDYLLRIFRTGNLLIVHFYVLRRAKIQKERRRLDIQYTGTIRDAACFSRQDSDRIWAEIGGGVLEVDHTIGMLVKAGVSTEELRQLDGLGLDVRGAADARFGSAIFSWAMFSAVGLRFALSSAATVRHGAPHDHFTQGMLCLLSLGCPALWLWIVAQQHVDRKTFSCVVATGASIVVLVGAVIPFEGPEGQGPGSEAATSTTTLSPLVPLCAQDIVMAWTLAAAGLACVALSWAGPLAVARRGCFGLWFAKLLVEGFSSRRGAGSKSYVCGWLTFLLGVVACVIGLNPFHLLIDGFVTNACVFAGWVMVTTGYWLAAGRRFMLRCFVRCCVIPWACLIFVGIMLHHS